MNNLTIIQNNVSYVPQIINNFVKTDHIVSATIKLLDFLIFLGS